MSNQLFYALLMLATGIGIPVMAALSSTLGTKYGSPAFAASVLFLNITS
jgi:transporter family-2 protein